MKREWEEELQVWGVEDERLGVSLPAGTEVMFKTDGMHPNFLECATGR